MNVLPGPGHPLYGLKAALRPVATVAEAVALAGLHRRRMLAERDREARAGSRMLAEYYRSGDWPPRED